MVVTSDREEHIRVGRRISVIQASAERGSAETSTSLKQIFKGKLPMEDTKIVQNGHA